MSLLPTPQVAIVDHRLGNLYNVRNACLWAGMAATVTADRHEIMAADAVILPGVGAFGDAMATLRRLDLVDVLRDLAGTEKPFVGICLGIQLLMTESFEFGHHQGLGIVAGQVVPFGAVYEGARRLKVPQVGWNQVHREHQQSWDGTLMGGIETGEYFYFVHSFVARPEDSSVVVATTCYGDVSFCAALAKGNVFASQFHPERSGAQGLRMYQNLVRQITARKAGAAA